MNPFTRRFLLVAFFGGVGLLRGGTTHCAGNSRSPTPSPAKITPIPAGVHAHEQDENPPRHYAYHDNPPKDPLPGTLEPREFEPNRAAVVAYSVAAKVKQLLYQEPCYCGCDRYKNHLSLLDCFTDRHGVTCHICQKEVIFTYEQSKLSKNAAEIRDAIEKGEFSKVDVEKYTEAHYNDYGPKSGHQRDKRTPPPPGKYQP